MESKLVSKAVLLAVVCCLINTCCPVEGNINERAKIVRATTEAFRNVGLSRGAERGILDGLVRGGVLRNQAIDRAILRDSGSAGRVDRGAERSQNINRALTRASTGALRNAGSIRGAERAILRDLGEREDRGILDNLGLRGREDRGILRGDISERGNIFRVSTGAMRGIY